MLRGGAGDACDGQGKAGDRQQLFQVYELAGDTFNVILCEGYEEALSLPSDGSPV